MRFFARLFCLVFIVTIVPGSLLAVNPPVGPEFQVNSHTTNGQVRPAVATNAAGDFVVVWDSYAQDGSARGVFGQLFDAAGLPIAAEFAINSHTTDAQSSPSVARSDAGSFLVVWQSTEQDGSDAGIYGQLYDDAGLPQGGEFLINTHTTLAQRRSSVAADGAGNFVVVWDSYGQDSPTDEGVFGQRFDPTGLMLGVEFQINSHTTDDQFDPAVGVDSAGNFMVAWTSYTQDGSGRGVFGQLFDSAGNPQGSELQVNSHTSNSQFDPAVGVDSDGNFIVVWSSKSQDGDGTGIFGQRYDPLGVPIDGEFQVNRHTPLDQLNPKVSTDDNGHFVVAWDSYDQDGSNTGVFGRRFNPPGVEFQVNSHTTGYQYGASIAVAKTSGEFVIIWQSGASQDGASGGIFGQRFINPDLFEDGFESDDTSGWDQTVTGVPQ